MKNIVDSELFWEFVSLTLPFDEDFLDKKNDLSFTQMYGNPEIIQSKTVAKFNGCAVFDGINDHLRYNHLDITTLGEEDFTLEFWFKAYSYGTENVGSYNGNRILFSTNTVFDTALSSAIEISLDDTVLKIRIDDYDLSESEIITTIRNKWYHIALTREGDIFRGYFNGGVIFEVQKEGINVTSANFMLGGSSPTTEPSNLARFHGAIDDFRYTKGYARYDDDFMLPTYPNNIGNTEEKTINYFPSIWFDAQNDVYDSSVQEYDVDLSNRSQSPNIDVPFIDGKNSYLHNRSMMSIDRDPTLIIGERDFTFESWINMPNTDGYHCLFASYGWGYLNYSFSVVNGRPAIHWGRTATINSGSLAGQYNNNRFGIDPSTGSARPENQPMHNFWEIPRLIKNRTWHHIAWSRKDGVNRLFVDGNKVAQFYNNWYWNSSSIVVGNKAKSVRRINRRIVSIASRQRIVTDPPWWIHQEEWYFYGYTNDLMFSRLVAKYTNDFKPERIVQKDRTLGLTLLDQQVVDIDDVDDKILKRVTANTNGDNVFWFNDNTGFVLQKPGNNSNGVIVDRMNRYDNGLFQIFTNTGRRLLSTNINGADPLNGINGNSGILDTFDQTNLTFKDVIFDVNTSIVESDDGFYIRPKSTTETGMAYNGSASLQVLVDFGVTNSATYNTPNTWVRTRFNTVGGNSIELELHGDGTFTLPAGMYYFSSMHTRLDDDSEPRYGRSRLMDLTNNIKVGSSIGGLNNYSITRIDKIDAYYSIYAPTRFSLECFTTGTEHEYGSHIIGPVRHQCLIYRVGI